MHEELIIAGAGGQGILFIGELLCIAAMKEGKHTTWFPSYGPAMRGGKANCTVIVSSEEIGSPISDRADSLIVMNKLSLEFVEKVKPRGFVIINKSLADWDNRRKDLKVLEIRANDIAKELGGFQVANMVILGAYLKRKRIVSLKSVIEALEEKLFGKEDTIELNKKALQKGWNES